MDELNDSEIAVETPKIELPDKNDMKAVKLFMDNLAETHGGTRGVQTLVKRLHNYVHHAALVVKGWELVETSVKFLNGERTLRGPTSPDVIARRFYNTLSTPGLHMQCNAFAITFDDYETIDEVIEALVEKHVQVMGNGS